MVSKFNTGLKSLLKQDLSEPEFYGDLVYKFRIIVGRNDFSDQFRKIIIRHKRIRYNMNVKRQTACLVVNPFTVNNFAALFNCLKLNDGSGIKLQRSWLGLDDLSWVGPTRVQMLDQRFSVGLVVEYSSCFISVMNLDLYVCCFDSLMSYKSFMPTE